MEFEKDADPDTLINLYKIAGAYGNAIRICIKNDLDDRIMMLALKQKCDKADMVTAARFLESKGLIDKAIQLYQKAGQLGKATDLAFNQGYYTNIEAISEDITSDSDARLIQRCIEYFVENNQVDRAVNLLVKVERLVEAVDLSLSHHMTIDEKFVSLILERSAASKINPESRKYIVQKLIDSCLGQGLYLEAARMLLESGQPESAMNALARTGDVDAISRYIRIIRDPEALVVAGNILQSHPWHQKRHIFDAIVLAYKRAGAHLYLASFYDSWGETACESGRYDIAKEAFTKSLDVLKTVQINMENQAEVESAKNQIDIKAKTVDYFLQTQKEAKSDPQNAIAAAEELLKHASWSSGVRTGHLYGFLISVAYSTKAAKICKVYLQKLEEECPVGFDLTDFVEESILSKIR